MVGVFSVDQSCHGFFSRSTHEVSSSKYERGGTQAQKSPCMYSVLLTPTKSCKSRVVIKNKNWSKRVVGQTVQIPGALAALGLSTGSVRVKDLLCQDINLLSQAILLRTPYLNLGNDREYLVSDQVTPTFKGNYPEWVHIFSGPPLSTVKTLRPYQTLSEPVRTCQISRGPPFSNVSSPFDQHDMDLRGPSPCVLMVILDDCRSLGYACR